jgi:PPOX class probable F420-dependent enzyme
MDLEESRRRVSEARVGRLATLASDGRPHLVPCCFALVGTTIYTAVDAKPKATTSLRRIENIRSDDRVTLLVDHYDEDWTSLWWVRVDGRARIVDGDPEQEREKAIGALVGKYPQYRQVAIPGPVVAIEPESWQSWSSRPSGRPGRRAIP